jgi:hypothetical protein
LHHKHYSTSKDLAESPYSRLLSSHICSNRSSRLAAMNHITRRRIQHINAARFMVGEIYKCYAQNSGRKRLARAEAHSEKYRSIRRRHGHILYCDAALSPLCLHCPRIGAEAHVAQTDPGLAICGGTPVGKIWTQTRTAEFERQSSSDVVESMRGFRSGQSGEPGHTGHDHKVLGSKGDSVMATISFSRTG